MVALVIIRSAQQYEVTFPGHASWSQAFGDLQAQGSLPQSVPQWHIDYFELKLLKNELM